MCIIALPQYHMDVHEGMNVCGAILYMGTVIRGRSRAVVSLGPFKRYLLEGFRWASSP